MVCPGDLTHSRNIAYPDRADGEVPYGLAYWIDFAYIPHVKRDGRKPKDSSAYDIKEGMSQKVDAVDRTMCFPCSRIKDLRIVPTYHMGSEKVE